MLLRFWNNACAQFKQDNADYQKQSFFHDTPLAKTLFILALFSLTFLILTYHFLGYHAYFMPINGLAHFAPNWLLQTLTVLGDTTVALMVVFILYKGDQRIIWLAICTAVISGTLVHFGKQAFYANRPASILPLDSFHLTGQILKRGSFPSGHSTTVFACVALLAFLHKHWSTRSLLLICGIIVALCRVWVGAHWPMDVVAGAFIGFISVCAAYLLCLRTPQGLSIWAQTFFLGLFVANSIVALFHNTGYPLARPAVIALAIWSLASLIWRYRPSKVNASQYKH